ncbi:helix-turn-helix domain-containing protein [Spirillospora sp. NPDC047279]|uniref:PucR family transcriptional regulator n=1 Tax=Spirillospora sp. NPDC047279 TaxID=3155478 RepID=UPI0033C93042
MRTDGPGAPGGEPGDSLGGEEAGEVGRMASLIRASRAGAADGTAEAASAPLRDVLSALGPLADLAEAPAGLDVPVHDIVISEPGDPPHARHGALVLVIGARGDAAAGLVRAAGRDGAGAIAVKASSTGGGDTGTGTGTGVNAGAGADERLRQVAAEAGIALLKVATDARWEQVETVVQAVLGHALATAGADLGDSHGDLFSLAETIATLTGGIVSIEDAGNHVVAYSRSDDEADELRRLTILTRDCPEQYLSVLREWGIYQRLRGGEEVVDVAEHPALGIRRRLVAGVSAGRRLLGTIWVQEGARPLDPRSGEVLRGATRLAALHLVRYRGEAALAAGLREDLAAALLDGRIPAGAVAAHVGIAPGTAVTVVSLDPRTAGAADAERSDRALRDARTVEIVSVYAAAYRQQALVTQLAGRIYLLLPEGDAGGSPGSSGSSGSSVVRWAQGLVTALRTSLGTPVQAGVAGPVPRLEDVPAARRDADRVLRTLARLPDRAAAAFDELRSSVVLDEVLALLAASPHVRDPALDLLVEHDRRHDTELARSLRGYLDAFGDVGKVAEELHVHPNTLRHRIRRAVALTGIDLDDPDQLLVAMLQLRLAEGGDG